MCDRDDSTLWAIGSERAQDGMVVQHHAAPNGAAREWYQPGLRPLGELTR
jgi:hypothetical protein